MLKLTEISKSYKVADFEQTALDKVSVAFRDNEFVAILGPSGSGKTTMLNIIGGLDRYDSGDLSIDDISTRFYKDRDWDTYRNNRIGFVFQSYNLIPHQTILANVELALTLSGVSREERRQRAIEALGRVGLGDHISKKPSQLSGGQMQRVAIARALINDPEILLADEPTGALDSKTSVQIMDLLSEVANDRLVIMVTHNPELAEQYANRIVSLQDGVITSDTNPYDPTAEEMKENAKQPRRTRMSFLTALSLSFKNLMTKKGRTFMTAFAGSIGIIGIAGILSLSNGVNNYILTVEEETLSEYPLQIQSTGFDLTSMLVSSASDFAPDDEGSSDDEGEEADLLDFRRKDTDTVRIANVISNAFTSLESNDLKSLKAHLESGETDIDSHVNAIEYSYNVTPQIFAADTSNGIHQVNPDKSFKGLGLGSGSTNSLMSMSMSTDVFYEMPAEESLYRNNYDVVAGRWPEKYNECILVLTPTGFTSDFMEYTLGFRDYHELQDMIDQFLREEDVSKAPDIEPYQYKDILDVSFKLVDASDFYAYDSEHGVYVDKSDNEDFMKDLIAEGEDLNIVGVVQQSADEKVGMLQSGINYLPSLTEHIIDNAKNSDIVKDQLADSTINVFTGKPFGEEEEDGANTLGLDSMFTIDESAMAQAFNINTSGLSMPSMDMDLSGLDLGSLSFDDVPFFDISSLQKPVDPGASGEGAGTGEGSGEGEGAGTGEGSGSGFGSSTPGGGNAAVISTAITEILQDFFKSADVSKMVNFDPAKVVVGTDPVTGDPTFDFSNALTVNPDFANEFVAYMQTPEVSQKLSEAIAAAIDTKGLEEQISLAMQDYVQNTLVVYFQNKMAQAMMQLSNAIQTQIASSLGSSLSGLGAAMSNAFSFDQNAFANAFKFDMNEDDLTELIMSLMGAEEQTYENNLKNLGYADLDSPSQIDIYPIDFENKDRVVEILDTYNENMEDAGDDEKVITYVDLVGTLMTSVTDIINKISAVMVACVAISLIVSSIMIGVITYISVLERKKEIGILRSIGASKRDIGNVFNAETVIVGLTAGLLGILITKLCSIPANLIVEAVFDVPQIAILPLSSAVALVALSTFLTFLAGLIPSSAASRKDPVEALRSE